MCLSAYYRSELECPGETLMPSVTRLKQLVMTVSALRDRAASAPDAPGTERTLGYRERLDQAVSDDLNTPRALPVLDEMLADKKLSPAERLAALTDFDAEIGRAHV